MPLSLWSKILRKDEIRKYFTKSKLKKKTSYYMSFVPIRMLWSSQIQLRLKMWRCITPTTEKNWLTEKWKYEQLFRPTQTYLCYFKHLDVEVMFRCLQNEAREKMKNIPKNFIQRNSHRREICDAGIRKDEQIFKKWLFIPQIAMNNEKPHTSHQKINM